MKKNIGYASIDSSSAVWLREHLPAGDLKRGIENLLCGKYSSLILETDTDELPAYDFSVIKCGSLVINSKYRKVQRDGTDIPLTPKEFDILFFLASNRGEVFTKEQIYQAVWENDYVMDSSNIMAFSRKLRKKIEPNPDSPNYILTICGIVYKFNEKDTDNEM